MVNTNTFIHNHSSLKNHTQFQTKMGKVYTCFRSKKAPKQNDTLWVGTYLYGLYKGVPPPPPSVGQYKVGVMGSTYLPKKPNQLLRAFSLFTQDIKLLLHVVPSHFQISPLYHTRLKQLQVQWLCVQNCTAGENLHLSQCLWSSIDPATV